MRSIFATSPSISTPSRPAARSRSNSINGVTAGFASAPIRPSASAAIQPVRDSAAGLRKLTRAWAESNYSYVLPNCMLKPESIRKDLELRIELGYYKPPHRPTEAFYDLSYWSEATGEAVPPPVGLPRNAIAG